MDVKIENETSIVYDEDFSTNAVHVLEYTFVSVSVAFTQLGDYKYSIRVACNDLHTNLTAAANVQV